MSKKSKSGMSVVNDVNKEMLAQAYAEEAWEIYDDDSEEVEMTVSELRSDTYHAFLAGANTFKGEWEDMRDKKPNPNQTILCRNDKYQVVLGFHDKERNGMHIYGYELYDYKDPADFGLVRYWKYLSCFD